MQKGDKPDGIRLAVNLPEVEAALRYPDEQKLNVSSCAALVCPNLLEESDTRSLFEAPVHTMGKYCPGNFYAQ